MEVLLTIKSEFDLSARLMEPKEKSDTVFLIVSGSGKGDLNGNFGRLHMNVYKKLCDYLLKLGYSTLRYNKRGVGNSKGVYFQAGLNDFLTDLDACVNYLRENTEYKNIILIGHSEGAILSTLYSSNHKIEGMILISGAGISLKTAMNAQLNFLIKEIKEMKGFKGILLRTLINEKKSFKKQEKFYSRIENSKKDVLRISIVKYPAKWMREHFEYHDNDLLDILKSTKIPTLAITGTKDVQADVQDLDNVEALQNNLITIRRIADMDHMLREYLGKPSILNAKKQYKAEQTQGLSETLFDELSNWIINNYNHERYN